MENVFLQYMNDRLSIKEKEKKAPGPVITISREYGCYGSQIAELLVAEINQKKNLIKKWDKISNEVLNTVADNLKVRPSEISHVFGAHEKTFLDNLFSSFIVSKRYVSDENVIHNIREIVSTYINQGNVVIVGRAGCVLAKDVPKSIHVKLVAPFEWRVAMIMKRFNISEDQAAKNVYDIDEKRKQFMGYFDGNKSDSQIFDIVINRATLSNEEIVKTILTLSETHKVFE